MRERPNNPDAVDLAMRGWAAFYLPDSAATYAEAIDDFERALRIDPQEPQALIGLSTVLGNNVNIYFSANPAEDADRAEALASQALSAHPESAAAHFAKAGAFMGEHNNGMPRSPKPRPRSPSIPISPRPTPEPGTLRCTSAAPPKLSPESKPPCGSARTALISGRGNIGFATCMSILRNGIRRSNGVESRSPRNPCGLPMPALPPPLPRPGATQTPVRRRLNC